MQLIAQVLRPSNLLMLTTGSPLPMPHVSLLIRLLLCRSRCTVFSLLKFELIDPLLAHPLQVIKLVSDIYFGYYSRTFSVGTHPTTFLVNL